MLPVPMSFTTTEVINELFWDWRSHEK